MIKFIKTAILSSLIFSSQAVSDNSNTDASEVKSKFYFNESVEHYNFNGDEDNILVLKQTVGFELDDTATLELSLPFISSTDDGFGMALLSLDKKFVSNPCEYVNFIAFNFGLELPTGQDSFAGDNLNVLFGFNSCGNTTIENLSWSAGVDWLVNNDESYVPILSGKVANDVFHVSAGLQYAYDNFVFGVAYDYWDGNDENYISTLGPTVSYAINNTSQAFGSVGFVLDQGDKNNTDTFVKLGLSLKF
jgi:hypothetical protein